MDRTKEPGFEKCLRDAAQPEVSPLEPIAGYWPLALDEPGPPGSGYHEDIDEKDRR